MVTNYSLWVNGQETIYPCQGIDAALLLVDLKTSKRVYPKSHFPQLAGYELASVEMGFPPTDAQFVLNTHPDGTYDFKRSWATPDDFIAFCDAMRAIKRLEDNDPEVIRKREVESSILANLPNASRTISNLLYTCGTRMGPAEVGRALGQMRKRGLVYQDGAKVWHRAK